MRLDIAPRVVTFNGEIDKKKLTDALTNSAAQVNALSEGRLSATTNAQAALPTTGVYAVGDFVRNNAPTELGAASSKYVILGWVCVAGPLTFVQCRVLTGN